MGYNAAGRKKNWPKKNNLPQYNRPKSATCSIKKALGRN
jgi:hypothetical protein